MNRVRMVILRPKVVILTLTPPLQAGKFRNWFFTLNNYTDADIAYWQNKESCPAKKFIFQEETGSQTGTKHLQGYFELANPRTFKGLITELGPQYHIEVSRNKQASIAYCQKLETRTGKVYSKGYRKPPKVLKNLYPWQQKIVDLINTEPDDRTINWYWDEKGGCGKSALAKYLCVNYDAMYVSGKAADIKYAIGEYLKAHDDLKVVIYDITRSLEAYVSYQSIEEVKNGIFFSGKYESEQMIFNSPHVIIFANFEPDESKLSADRWRIINLGE